MRWGHQIACGIVCTIGAAAHADEFTTAAGYYTTEQWREAFVAFDRLVRLTPDHPQRADAEFFCAEALVQLGEFDAAARRFAAFLASNPNHPMGATALFRIGESYYLAGDWKQAIPLLERFTKRHPRHELNEYALPYCGLALAETSDRDPARRTLVEALRRFPRGSLAHQAGQRLLELEYEQQNASGLRAALSALAQARPETVDSAEWHFWQGRLNQLDGQLKEAVREFELSVAADSGEGFKARALYEGAQIHIAQRDLAAALVRLTALGALTESRELVERSYAQRIELLAQQQRADEAISLTAEFRERFGNTPSLRQMDRLVAELHLQQSDVDGATEVLQRLIATPDANADDAARMDGAVNRYQLARVRYQAGDFAAALAALRELEAETLPSALAARIHYARGSSHHQLQQYDEALAALERAAAVPTDDSFAARIRWKHLLVRAQAGQWHEALEELQSWDPNEDETIWFYRQAARYLAEAGFASERYNDASTAFALLVMHVKDGPDVAYGLSGLAWCYLRQESWTAAADLFRRVTDRFPDCPQAPAAMLGRAYCFESINDLDAATAAYRQFIQRFPDNPGRWRADLKLAELLERQQEGAAAVQVIKAGIGAAQDDHARDRLSYQLALLHGNLGHKDAAHKILLSLYQQGPSGDFWAEVTYRLSRDALTRGDLASAARLVDELLVSPRGNVTGLAPYGLYLRARIAAHQGDWQTVLASLDDLQIAYPQSQLLVASRVWSIEALHRLGDHENVRHRVNSLAETFATLKPAWQRLVVLRDGQALAESGETQQAIERVRSLAQEKPHDKYWAEANVLVGRCEVQLKQYDRAHESLRQVLEGALRLERETQNAGWCAVGDAYLGQGSYEQALDAYLRVRPHAQSRWYAAALLGAAEALEKLGRVEDALPVLRRLANSHLDTLYRARARELIQNSTQATNDAAEPQLPVSTTSRE
jgi:tetratricopeptide (TPR) repeat protein